MFKSLIAAALLSSAIVPAAFANVNAGSKVYISSVPVGAIDLVKADYEALTWVLISAVGNLGETGNDTNLLNYDTWDTDVSQMSKGVTKAGTPALEVARIPTDPGQLILRTAVTQNVNYGFKVVRNDAVVGGQPTTIYHRGLVVGPKTGNGRVEDFDIETYTLGMNQRQLIVNPTTGGVAPTNTVQPAITGTASSGQVLTVSNGTFTGDATITYAYQWFAGGVAVAGATANTFTLTAAQVGKIMQARVAATNGAGSATAFSNATSAVS